MPKRVSGYILNAIYIGMAITAIVVGALAIGTLIAVAHSVFRFDPLSPKFNLLLCILFGSIPGLWLLNKFLEYAKYPIFKSRRDAQKMRAKGEEK